VSKFYYFDSEWYLAQYPDVAAAGIDPREHYEKHGRAEGRLPCFLPSIAEERRLWANAMHPTGSLKALDEAVEEGGVNGVYASKVLADFHIFSGSPSIALKAINNVLANQSIALALFDPSELFLLQFSCFLLYGDREKASSLIADKKWKENSSKFLAREMLSEYPDHLIFLNRLFNKNGLSKVSSVKRHVTLDSLDGSVTRLSSLAKVFNFMNPKMVSVIVPCFNAEKTIATSLKSLKYQSYPHIEIVVVDDGSTDNTLQELRRLATDIANVRVVSNKSNKGAYTSRNIGMSAATGDFVTVMDADDWAHPQKIEKQVTPLLFNRKMKGTVSHWVRCTEDLKFSKLRAGSSWVHRNVSSLLIRKEVLDTLGGWDEVKVNADTEFYERCLAKYGKASIKEVMPDVPLSFGRTHASSLTQSSETHLVTQYGGLRKQYMDFARIWHNHSKDLKITNEVSKRSFPVPPGMLHDSKLVFEDENKRRFDRWHKALDENWYGQIYTDVSAMGLDIHDHFWKKGEREERYPSPLFNPQAYAYKLSLPSSESPTWHAINNDNWDFSIPVTLSGGAVTDENVSVAVFGHSVSKAIFGAERSLVDMVRALHKHNLTVTLFLPAFGNSSYIEELLPLVKEIVFIPLPWAKNNRNPYEAIEKNLVSLYDRKSFDCIYVNTLTLVEPLSAAKEAGVPCITHVRELVDFDDDLARLLQESPNQTRERVISSSDYFIANSYETARWLSCNERTKVIYNCVDIPTGQMRMPSMPLRVCMISSNVRKKGVEDFFKVASTCKKNSKIQFTLFGPITSDVASASRKFGDANVTIAGYVDDPLKSIAQNHIVLSLSHFKESFGRTVAEAMSLGRIVVGYNWGAVAELVDQNSGVLVEFGDTEAIANTLVNFEKNPSSLKPRSTYSVQRAKKLFSRESFEAQLASQIVKIAKKSVKISK